VLYVRDGVSASVDIPKLRPAPDAAPERFETGTLNHEGIVGAAAAVDFFAGLAAGATRRDRLATALAALHVRGNGLVARLWKGLSAIPGVRLYGVSPERPRTPTVAFTIAGMSSERVAGALADMGIFVSHGDFYAATVIERLGAAPGGLVRAGCACYTTHEEVDALIAAVDSISAMPAARAG
jgi:selenocysteine lyase/cysteine desulfurase